MQLTIDVPDHLAKRISDQRGNLIDIIERGLLDQLAMRSAPGKEVIAFLARGPRPEEILAFRPSQSALDRSRHLLFKNSKGELSAEEQDELDLLARVDQLMTLIK